MKNYRRHLVKRVVEFGSDLNAFVDRLRFDWATPGLRHYQRGDVFYLGTELRAAYSKYMMNCTKDDMPVTFGLACFLLAALRQSKPMQILDLGSGFSTYVCRFFIEEQAKKLEGAALPNLTSVDDSDYWLEKTKEFLAHRLWSTAPHLEFLSWEKFQANQLKKYDFIFVDLGSIEFRASQIDLVLDKYLAPGGVALLDDMHFEELKMAALRSASRLGCSAYSLATMVKDEYCKVPYYVRKGNSY